MMIKESFGILLFSAVISVTVSQRRTLSDVEYYCGNKPADVVFMLDVSNSIWAPDFQKQLTFVEDVIDMFTIANNVTRIGIATFSSHVYRQFYLDDSFDKSDIKKAIGRITQRQGFSTNTGLAIWHLRKRMLLPNRGARDGVAKVGIILTDGQSQNMGRTIYEAFRAKMMKIHMFAIGIGERVNKRELRAIASNPASEYMFTVDNYSALESIKNNLAVRTCRVTTPTTTPAPTTVTTTTTTVTTTTTPTTTTTSQLDAIRRFCMDKAMDVVFAIDSSGSVEDNDYIKQAEFFTKLADSFDVSPNQTRVSSILYSDQIQEMFRLVDYDSNDGVKQGMSQLGMTAGSGRVDLALKHILTKSFRRTVTRPDAAQVGIVITGSPARYLELTKETAKKAKQAGVEYIVIGVGPDVDEEELRIAAGSNEDNIYRLQSYDELEYLIPDIARQVCQIPPPELVLYDQACGSKQEADIMFLMDSVNAGRRNTKKSLEFLKSLASEMDIDNDNVHIGLMSAECEQDMTGFELGSMTSKKKIEQTVDGMKGTDFHKILHSMRRTAFQKSDGSRKHAKKFAILIIDGSLEEPIKTLTEAQRAKIRGIEVFVIQVGDAEPQEEVLMMCDDPSSKYFYKVNSYSDLPALKHRLLQSLCDEL